MKLPIASPASPGLHIVLGLLMASTAPTVSAQSLPLAPMPMTVTKEAGKGMQLPTTLVVRAPDAWRDKIAIVGEPITRMTKGRHRVRFVDSDEANCVIKQLKSLGPEAYELDILEEKIELRASSGKGIARGAATLAQLIGGLYAKEPNATTLPRLRIKDAPQASYRSFMIDMGRNPHSSELLKETVDLLWFYKVDSLHLHLTDDQRFAWPSTAFPKLWDGLISRKDFQELEAYAAARGITIIPELEVPGHSSLLCSNYPEVFGKSSKELAESETALKGVKTLLDELMEVFASTPYIHIGGDEAFGVPEEAQRDLINKLNAYLKSKGRQTVVWEGPRVGAGANKVSTEVIHINWRTIAYPADQMLKDGYRVVNATWDPLYIVDHYPRINFTMTSPEHIYKTLKLTRFKHVNPGIPTFANPINVPPSDRLIGFCMPWWEGREENYFAQNVPRIIPFAEVAWRGDAKRDYSEFAERIRRTETTRRALFYPVDITASDLAIPADRVFHRKTHVRLATPLLGFKAEIRYTTDGTAPTIESPLYTAPISLNATTVVRAAAFAQGKQVGHGTRSKWTAVDPVENLAFGKPVTSSAPSASPFSVERLTDGGTGNLDFYLGYPAEPKPIRVTVDLGEAKQVSRVVVHAYSINNSAEKYTVEVSADGKTFSEVGSRQNRPDKVDRPSPQAAVPVEFKFAPQNARFVRIVTNGNKGYVFDSFSKLVEIQVY